QYLNPVLAATPVDDDVVRLVFSGLSRFRSDGSIQGDLAQTFSSSEDGKVWTFQIRDDATWQDGKPVISDDVVYTVGLLQDKAYVRPSVPATTPSIAHCRTVPGRTSIGWCFAPIPTRPKRSPRSAAARSTASAVSPPVTRSGPVA